MFFWLKHGPGLVLIKNSKVNNRLFSVNTVNKLKFIQFLRPNTCDIRVGYIQGGCVIDINARDPCLPKTMLGLLQNKNHMEKILELESTPSCEYKLHEICLQAPIHGMDKVLCIGLNYKDHCKMHNLKPPPVPMVFSKFSSTIIGPNDRLLLRTEVTKNVDYEVELCAVIGKKATCIQPSEAFGYVFGYMIAQDISARDWQKDKNGGQFLLGKSMDTFCPIGPWIVTSDEIGDPENLDISCSVNGCYKQKSNTKNLIHRLPDVISRLSHVMTLLPGDIILTGTPGGVGVYAKPPEFLKPGDILCSEIENIGSLQTNIDVYDKNKHLVLWSCDHGCDP